jgi:hypothetical protein
MPTHAATRDCALTKPSAESDPELAHVLSAWASVSDPLEAAILALVESALIHTGRKGSDRPRPGTTGCCSKLESRDVSSTAG